MPAGPPLPSLGPVPPFPQFAGPVPGLHFRRRTPGATPLLLAFGLKNSKQGTAGRTVFWDCGDTGTGVQRCGTVHGKGGGGGRRYGVQRCASGAKGDRPPSWFWRCRSDRLTPLLHRSVPLAPGATGVGVGRDRDGDSHFHSEGETGEEPIPTGNSTTQPPTTNRPPGREPSPKNALKRIIQPLTGYLGEGMRTRGTIQREGGPIPKGDIGPTDSLRDDGCGSSAPGWWPSWVRTRRPLPVTTLGAGSHSPRGWTVVRHDLVSLIFDREEHR